MLPGIYKFNGHIIPVTNWKESESCPSVYRIIEWATEKVKKGENRNKQC
jgi:hypothetical protein